MTSSSRADGGQSFRMQLLDSLLLFFAFCPWKGPFLGQNSQIEVFVLGKSVFSDKNKDARS